VRGKTLIAIYILEILEKHSSYTKRLSQENIITFLENEYNLSFSRRALHEYIKVLKKEGYIAGERGVYKINDFTDAEVRVLIDGILFSKTLSEDAAKELINKLKNLSSVNLKDRIKHVYYLKDMTRTSNDNMYEIIDKLDDAINSKKKVKITQGKYDVNGNLIEKNKKIISPYYIVTHKSLYYLICNSERDNNLNSIENRKIDKIIDVEVLKEKSNLLEDMEKYKNKPFNLAEYMNEHIYMFSGDSARIKIKVKKNSMDCIIDWFGKNYDMVIEDGDYVIISVVANVNATYYWALQYGGCVEILKPLELREKIKMGLESVLEKYLNNY